MTKLIDFNMFRAERDAEPVILVIGEDRYELPPTLPVSVALDMIEMKATLDDSADVPLDMLGKTGEAVFGDELWQSLLVKHHIGVDEIGPLIQMVLAAYSPVDEDDDTDPSAASTQETTESSSAS